MAQATSDPQLAALEQLLGDRAGALLFPCIKDLVAHGLDLTRFGQGEGHPNRQDVTMYLAAWLKHAGLTSDILCTSWLTDYCASKLAAISSSSPSQIRHSAKSALKYVLRAAVPFTCRRADNSFRAHCSHGCAQYALGNQPAAVAPRAVPNRVVPLPPAGPKKARFAEQFAEAIILAGSEVENGKGFENVVALLNEKGYKTRTGRPWSASILRAELRKHETKRDSL